MRRIETFNLVGGRAEFETAQVQIDREPASADADPRTFAVRRRGAGGLVKHLS